MPELRPVPSAVPRAALGAALPYPVLVVLRPVPDDVRGGIATLRAACAAWPELAGAPALEPRNLPPVWPEARICRLVSDPGSETYGTLALGALLMLFALPVVAIWWGFVRAVSGRTRDVVASILARRSHVA